MKKLSILLSGILILSVLLFFSCAGKKEAAIFWGSAEEGFKLVYKMPVNTSFTFSSSSGYEQTLEIMGNEQVSTQEGEVENIMTVKSIDPEGNLEIEVDIKKITQNTEEAGGSLSPDFSEAIGKKIKMTVTPKGKASGFEGIEDLPEVIIDPQGSTMTKELYVIMFEGFFFTLSDVPKKIGESWSETKEHTVKQGGLEIKIVSNITYTLLEDVQKDGIDCLKIGVNVKQKWTGGGEQGGAELTFDLEGGGDGDIYFAYKKGMFISSESTGKLEGTVETQGMSFPLVRDLRSKVNINFVTK